MTETVLGLMRHGQTDWNIELRLQGSSDIPLNETGREQARLASKKLNLGDWDLVLASPLSRATETAGIIAHQLGLEVVIVPELVERSFGVAEGLSHPQWRELYESGKPIPGLETIDELRVRAEAALRLIASNYDGRKVLAVSHGAFIRKLLRVASNNQFPKDGDRLGNVSLSRLGFEDASWSVLDYDPNSLGL